MGMVDVSRKLVSFRSAQASGQITLAEDAFLAVTNGTNPKGDVLSVAEIAAINGVKQCSHLLPLCHPFSIENVNTSFGLKKNTNAVQVTCEVSTHSRTGVEMEALAGVQAALLCIYDLSKAVKPGPLDQWNSTQLETRRKKRPVDPPRFYRRSARFPC